ncbi:MAG: alpha/beta hydrolase [Proteobacteria bacterium]|nr:alpha/beta hydrolase [Pseudomonadota bacterium]
MPRRHRIKKTRILLFGLPFLIVAAIAVGDITQSEWFDPTVGSRLTRMVVTHYLAPKFSSESTVEGTREALDTITRLTILPKGTQVQRLEVAGRPAEWVLASSVLPFARKTILYIHGGGFYCGSASTHRELAARISRAAGVRVLVPEYRLAPEHKYPAANEDCLNVYKWLLDHGVESKNITIGGDSAGGCLALMTLLSIRDQGLPMPAAAFFLSPLTDAVHQDGETYTRLAEVDPWFDPPAVALHMIRYTGDKPPEDQPEILSPVNMDLSGLPPLFIQVGSDEILLSDSTRLAERAQKAGVDVTLEVWPHMWHVFQSFGVMVPEARQAIDNIGAFVRKKMA